MNHQSGCVAQQCHSMKMMPGHRMCHPKRASCPHHPLQCLGQQCAKIEERKISESHFRTNLDFVGFYLTFIRFGILVWIRNGHGIKNPFVKCEIHSLFGFFIGSWKCVSNAICNEQDYFLYIAS